MKNILRVPQGIIITTIFITFLMCSVLYAAEETLPTPEEIIAKNIEAMGGKEARKKIKNKKIFTFRKQLQMNREFTATEYMERPDKYYILYDTPGGIARSGSNGKIAWTIQPQNGPHLYEGAELSWRLFSAKIDPPDIPYKSMKTEGIEKINGKECYKVVKTPEKGTEKIVYYDKNSFMILKTIDYFEIPRGKYMNETYYEEYQKIDNILFEYKTVVFQNGERISEYTHNIELNIEMPEGIFDIPEEVKAIMDKNETEQHAQQ